MRIYIYIDEPLIPSPSNLEGRRILILSPHMSLCWEQPQQRRSHGPRSQWPGNHNPPQEHDPSRCNAPRRRPSTLLPRANLHSVKITQISLATPFTPIPLNHPTQVTLCYVTSAINVDVSSSSLTTASLPPLMIESTTCFLGIIWYICRCRWNWE